MKLLTRRRSGAAAVALAMVGAVLIPTQAHAATPVLDEPITLDHGHIDAFTPVLNDDGSLRLTVKEDVTPPGNVVRTPESVELFVKESAWLEGFPAHFQSTIGIPEAAYHLPLTQDHNLIWPGWETQLITSEYPGANTDIVVSEVDGPGDVFLWTQSGFGAITSLMHGEFKFPATISQPYPAHTHAAWAFTEPGTYKFTVRADVTASNGNTASTQTATYTFVVAARTQLTPEAPVQEGNTVTIPAQKWITYTDADGAPIAAGELELSEDLTVVAHPAFGFELADDADAEWNLAYEEPIVQTVTIEGLRHHYHQGAPIVLTAVSDPVVEGAAYEWLLQRRDQSEPVLVEGENGAELSIDAEQALDAAEITVRLLDAEGEELADARATIEIDDHGDPAFNVATISGAAHHYHTGDTAELIASVDPASVLSRWVWEVQLDGETEWAAVDGVNGAAYSFEVTGQLDGALVRAALVFENDERYVVSEPVLIAIDDHHDDGHGHDDDDDHGHHHDDDSEDDAPKGENPKGGQLPDTGSEAPIAIIALSGALLLLLGAGALMRARRRNTSLDES